MNEDIFMGLENKQQFEKKFSEFYTSSKARSIKKGLNLPTNTSEIDISLMKSMKPTYINKHNYSQKSIKISSLSTNSVTPIKHSQLGMKIEQIVDEPMKQSQISMKVRSIPCLSKVDISSPPNEKATSIQVDTEENIYMDLFTQQIEMLSNPHHSDMGRKEAEKISQEFGISYAIVCSLATPELREDFIIKSLQEQVQDSLNQQKERLKNRNINQTTGSVQDNDIYSWLDVQSKFISLKEKLKFALVQAINEPENQHHLIDFIGEIKQKKSSQDKKAEIQNYPKPDTRNIINELTDLLKQVKQKKFTSLVNTKQDDIEQDRIEKIKKDAQQMLEKNQENIVRQKLEQTSIWDDEKEKSFKMKRASAKERLSKMIKTSSWNQLGCAEFVKEYNDQSTNVFQRDHLLNKYTNGDQLNAQEFEYLTNTSELLNRCCDQKQINITIEGLFNKLWYYLMKRLQMIQNYLSQKIY